MESYSYTVSSFICCNWVGVFDDIGVMRNIFLYRRNAIEFVILYDVVLLSGFITIVY